MFLFCTERLLYALAGAFELGVGEMIVVSPLTRGKKKDKATQSRGMLWISGQRRH